MFVYDVSLFLFASLVHFSLTLLHPPAIIRPLKVRNQADGPACARLMYVKGESINDPTSQAQTFQGTS